MRVAEVWNSFGQGSSLTSDLAAQSQISSCLGLLKNKSIPCFLAWVEGEKCPHLVIWWCAVKTQSSDRCTSQVDETKIRVDKKDGISTSSGPNMNPWWIKKTSAVEVKAVFSYESHPPSHRNVMQRTIEVYTIKIHRWVNGDPKYLDVFMWYLLLDVPWLVGSLADDFFAHQGILGLLFRVRGLG